MKRLPPLWKSPILWCVLLLCGLELPALATTHNVKTECGAAGNNSTDDTSAIDNCISHLVSGDTLLFPAGTYLITSQLSINVPNVIIDGSSNTATIHDTASGGKLMRIGSGGSGSGIALSANAAELATSFTTTSSLGVSAGDYVYIHEGGLEGSGTTTTNTTCDVSGCRAEVLKVASVSGNTVTVTTALHYAYNTVNGATANKVTSPLTGITLQNITLDANKTAQEALEMDAVVNSTISGVTIKNATSPVFSSFYGYNNSWTNVTITGGSIYDGTQFALYFQGNLTVSGLSVSGGSNGIFPFWLSGVGNSTFGNVTVDAAGTVGRPFKMTGSAYNTFNSLTVKNGSNNSNGISLEYYSSHNTFNNCTVTNNSSNGGTGTGNAGINLFGNFVSFNSFNNCTVTGNGNLQYYDSGWWGTNPPTITDTGNTISGGTYTGVPGGSNIYIQGTNDYIHNVTSNGSGVYGLALATTGACVNNNTVSGTWTTAAISSSNSTNIGSGNVIGGGSSDLTAGTCGSSGGPAPPTGLVASVQ